MQQTVNAPAIGSAVFAAQSTFRKVMDAMARPGSIQTVASTAAAPGPLSPAAAAIALTLFDHDTPIWLGAPFATDAIASWLRFNTGCPIVGDQGQSAFALAGDSAALPPLETFALGTPDYPDRSTTVILQVGSLTDGPERPGHSRHGDDARRRAAEGYRRAAVSEPGGVSTRRRPAAGRGE
jgi:alpha-D-ribose 1-methylphosphonate 5-triphosphate synthase subunit PhnH